MNTILLSFLGLSAAVILCALRWPPHASLHTHIDVDATPEQVWQWLGRPESYADWNPFIISMQGRLIAGEQLLNVMQSTGKKAMTFKPQVLKANAPCELRWRGRLLIPGLFDGEHYFELHRHGNSTRLHHGEKFSGVLLWFMNVDTFRADFERMNKALKAVSESGHNQP